MQEVLPEQIKGGMRGMKTDSKDKKDPLIAGTMCSQYNI